MAGENERVEPEELQPQPEPQPDSEPEDVPDKHGEPGINREKYERDIEERDNRIAELEAQIEEAAKSEEAREALKAEFEAYKAEQADKDLNYDLERAGCRNAKAAKALLGDYGSVADLKEAEPWLFEDSRKGKTGLPPASPASDHERRVSEAREAAGTAHYYK